MRLSKYTRIDNFPDRRSIIVRYKQKDISFEELNKLRRYLYDDMPGAAIDAITVNKNTSGTPDEIYLGIFSHVRVDSKGWNGKTVNYMGEQFMGSFKLGVVGKSRENPGMGSMIRVGDLVPSGTDGTDANGLVLLGETDKAIWLREGEEIDAILYVRKGVAGSHAKFMQITVAYVKLPNDQNDFISFVIESRGTLDPTEIFNYAIKELGE
jgi:hypothetical protein